MTTADARSLAWDLQVELATRVGTQPLLAGEGHSFEALSSLEHLATTAQQARACAENSPSGERLRSLADDLQAVLSPFLERWRDRPEAAAFFRDDFASLAVPLSEITQALAEITDTDLTHHPLR